MRKKYVLNYRDSVLAIDYAIQCIQIRIAGSFESPPEHVTLLLRLAKAALISLKEILMEKDDE